MSGGRSSIEERVEWTPRVRFRCATDKTVLRTLARWFAWHSDGTQVRVDNEVLAAKSGIPLRSVERALGRLVDGGWLAVEARRNRGRTTYCIDLDRLATEDPNKVRLAADHAHKFDRRSGGRNTPSTARVAVENEFDRQSGGRSQSGGRESRPDLDEVAVEVAAGSSCTYQDRNQDQEEEEETSVHKRSSSSDPGIDRHSGGRSGGRIDLARQFVAWWLATYPLHNHDAQSAAVGDAELAWVTELLQTYTVDKLKTMAIRLWTVTADSRENSDRTWIARSDRGLRVLHHKAHALDRFVSVPYQLAFGPLEEAPLDTREIAEATTLRARVYNGCPHEPRCASSADCVREIALSRRVAR